jgi:SOS-response transcriptional repressor LexA
MDYIRWFKKCIDETAEPREKTKVKKEVAERMGIALPTFHARLRGEGEFSTAELDRAAEYFGKESPARRRAQDNVVQFRPSLSPANADTVSYPILGAVEAGAFREIDLLSQVEPKSVEAARSTTFPNAKPMAWVAHGDSMNEAKIFDGMIILGVDFQDAGGVLTNNTIVVVEQNRGGLIERSVKVVAVYPDRTEFQPRSTNPVHRPIVYKNGNRDEDVEVRVLTVIHGAYVDMSA